MVLLSNRLTTVTLGYYVKEQLDKKCISTERVANLLDCKVSDVDVNNPRLKLRACIGESTL